MEKFYAGGFFFNPKTNSVLLHKRDGNAKVNPNKWAFFGGLNEGEETPVQTFIREIEEELGVDLEAKDVLPLSDYFNEILQTYRFVFYVESEMEKSEMRLGEGEDFDWIPLDKVFDHLLTEKSVTDLKYFIESKKL